ncbi:MAG TPA: CoA-transferase [Candidatus Limnocylindrales bacterium]|nr:CoA-transferase [Candidatus Limnocylindrales bacterium]
MNRKILSMQEAIARFVRDGMSIVAGTALESLIPFSAGHEIIRQGRRDLTLIGPISDILFDLLIGAGCVRKVVAAWVGNVMMGSGYNFRRAVEEGIPHPIDVEDHSNFTIALALHAAALGVPYLPTKTALGSDLPVNHPGMKEIGCPFTGEKLLAVQAIHPDIAIIQVQRCDPEGNAHIWGNTGITGDAARASRSLILVTEEIVSPDIIRSDPNRTLIPGFLVSAVVEEPWGAHPSPVQGYYNRDHGFYKDYHEETKTLEGFQKWLNRWVKGVETRHSYLQLLGEERIQELKVKKEALSAPANFGY